MTFIYRVFNLICAAAGLVVLSPLFAAAALAIKWDDGGPMLYAQWRIGRGFQPFRLVKFRSMVINADQAGLLTVAGDPRTTRIGRVLRKYKIDELPQLWNVLKGEMQLVGPRPEVAGYVEMFRAEYAPLLTDPPGITDPASLAYRHEETFLAGLQIEDRYLTQILPEKLKLSLAYQQQRSFLSEVRILFETVLRVAS